MRKDLVSKGVLMLISLGISLSIFTLPVWSAETAAVDATVIIANLSVTVSDAIIDYGALSVGQVQDTTTADVEVGIDDSQTATNTSNIVADLNIKGADASPVSSGATWTLASTAGSDTFTHKFCTVDCDLADPLWTALNSSTYESLATGVAAETGQQIFDLELGAPTSVSDYTQKSTTVTIQVVHP